MFYIKLIFYGLVFLAPYPALATCQEVISKCFANASGTSPLEQTSSVYRQLWSEIAPNMSSQEFLALAKGDPLHPTALTNHDSASIELALGELKRIALESKIPIEELNKSLKKVLLDIAKSKLSNQQREGEASEAAALPLVVRLSKPTKNLTWNRAGTLLVGPRWTENRVRSLIIAVDKFGNEIEYNPGVGHIKHLISLDDGRVIICNQSGLFEMQILDSKGKLTPKTQPKNIYSFTNPLKDNSQDLDLLKLLQDGDTLRLHIEKDLIFLKSDGKEKVAVSNVAGSWDQDDAPILMDTKSEVWIVSRHPIQETNGFNFRDLKSKKPNREILVKVNGFPKDGRTEFTHLLASKNPGKILGIAQTAYTRPEYRPILIEFELSSSTGVIKEIKGPIGDGEKKGGTNPYRTPTPLKEEGYLLVERGSDYFLLNALTGESKKFPLRQWVAGTATGEAFFSLVSKSDRHYYVVPYTNQLLLTNRASSQEISLVDLGPLLKKYK